MVEEIELAIVGSREFSEGLFTKNIDNIRKNLNLDGIIMIHSGGARGVDTFARNYGVDNHIPIIEHIPDWNKYGKSAGVFRNSIIVNSANYLLAFWDGESRGSLDSIKKAIFKPIPTKVFVPKNKVPETILKDLGLTITDMELVGLYCYSN